MGNDTISKSWFCVMQHPEEHGYVGSPQEICDGVLEQWIGTSSTNTGAVLYCISASEDRHLHCVFESSMAMRFSKIKKIFADSGMHIEATKGSKEQVEAYIHKRSPFDEKGEEIIYCTQRGALQGSVRREKLLEQIEELINQEMRPSQIMGLSIYYRQYEALVRKTYYAKRLSETPTLREVLVYWHVGASGTGKSYSYVQLCEKYGEDNVYMMSDMESGGLDNYEGQKILFIDEFKGQTPYYKFLQMLDKYKIQIHARYANAYALWNEVYITSVYPPEEAYKFMVDNAERETDSVKQLLRRISVVVFHYIKDTEYCTFSQKMKDYTDYATLKQLAHGRDGFIPVHENDQAEIPFT